MEVQPKSFCPYSVFIYTLYLPMQIVLYEEGGKKEGEKGWGERRKENEREREERQILLSNSESVSADLSKFPGKNDLSEQLLELFLSCGKWGFSEPSSSCNT